MKHVFSLFSVFFLSLLITGNTFAEGSFSPQEVTNIPLAGETKAIERWEDFLFLVNTKKGLIIMNIKKPESPKTVAEISIPGEAKDLEIEGVYAYILDIKSTLHIVDIAHPQNPKYVTSVSIPGRAQEIFVEGKRAYISDITTGIHILNLNNPKKPKYHRNYETHRILRGILRKKHIPSLRNISAESNTIHLAENTPLSNIRHILQHDDFVYYTDEKKGVLLLEKKERVFQQNKKELNIKLYNDVALVSRGGDGLFLYSLENLENGDNSERFVTNGNAWDAVLGEEEYFFVADGSAGLIVGRFVQTPEIPKEFCPFSDVEECGYEYSYMYENEIFVGEEDKQGKKYLKPNECLTRYQLTKIATLLSESSFDPISEISLNDVEENEFEEEDEDDDNDEKEKKKGKEKKNDKEKEGKEKNKEKIIVCEVPKGNSGKTKLIKTNKKDFEDPVLKNTLKRCFSAPSVEFSDHTLEHWATPYLGLMIDQEIMSGYADGSFGGDNCATRAEFTKVILESFESPLHNTEQNPWYLPWISFSEEKNIVIPQPEKPISRKEALKWGYHFKASGDHSWVPYFEGLRGYDVEKK